MKVTLISHTPDADKLVAIAGRTCYSNKDAEDLWKNISDKTIENIIPKLHGSVFEHITFTFAVSGVSRSCSHQLVRHRVGVAFSQESMRYVKYDSDNLPMTIPPSVVHKLDDADIRNLMDNYDNALSMLCDKLDEMGVPPEDVRYFYPQATQSNLVVTMNARELLHFFSIRCCNRAQWEIRELANRMLAECKRVYPNIFKNAGPSCVQFGKCPEHETCGKLIEVKN